MIIEILDRKINKTVCLIFLIDTKKKNEQQSFFFFFHIHISKMDPINEQQNLLVFFISNDKTKVSLLSPSLSFRTPFICKIENNRLISFDYM